MGSSGSGKTTLLNYLAQRFQKMEDVKYSGMVNCNNRTLEQGDFGKIGAYIQQDDILISTMTPREAFKFAARLRTSLEDETIERKINELLKRLRLTNCQNTKIGNPPMMKGLSGGERKRVSIGYELITDPKLIILDEPTSGLDSFTALKIMSTLKKDAERNGLTIVTTIHLPSSQLF